jgi:outer membrane protein OmpA-like peptidoglycan-associated protein
MGLVMGLGIGAAHADSTKGWYVGALGGLNITEDSDITTDAFPGLTPELTTNLGWGAGLLGGYDFGPFRIQADVVYRRNGLDKLKFAGAEADLDGHVSSWAPMVSALYDIPTGTRFTPYIGAGVGAAHVKFDSDTIGGSTSKWKFAYQAIGGVNYDLNTNWALGVEYRYFATPSIRDNGVEADYHNHSVFLGVTYKFAPPPPPPAPIAEAPPPPPPPAPELARSYMVFFDWNSSAITPEAATIIEEAAKAAKQLAVTRIDLTGHADRSGSPAYNQKLSVKRGEAVKNALVALGTPADQIAVVGKGETSPLVPTADGVREPQNRRVEIVLP